MKDSRETLQYEVVDLGYEPRPRIEYSCHAATWVNNASCVDSAPPQGSGERPKCGGIG